MIRILLIAILLTTEIYAQTYPKTVSECVDSILVVLPLQDKALVKHTLHKNLIMYHHGMGTWIRNRYGLWGKNDSLLIQCAKLKNIDYIHPDDVSGIIIDSLWNRLQNVNIDFTIPQSIEIKSENLGESDISILKNYIVFPDVAWRVGLNAKYIVKIETDENREIKEINFIPNDEMAGFIYQNEKSIKENWLKILNQININAKSQLSIEINFNSLGKKFEEYMKN